MISCAKIHKIILFATRFWAKNDVWHKFKMLSQVVEQDFRLFLGFS